MYSDSVITSIERRRDQLSDLASFVWSHPEVALQETESSAQLQATLHEAGFTVNSNVAGMETAFVAQYGDSGPVIGTMGEFDALPGMSQQVCAEQNPIEEDAPGHGCGHNLFCVGSLAGALAVKDAIDNGLNGTVIYYGTPAEEAGGGKVYMTQDDVFDAVDAIISWHPGWYNSPGKGSCLSVNSFKIGFTGESSHAAGAPEAGRSALDALQLLNTGIEYMREHVSTDARIHYVVTNGGDAPNVVPAAATGEYLIRAPERQDVERISEWVHDAAKGAALMAGVDSEVTKLSGYSGILPNTTLADAIYESMTTVGSINFDSEQRAFASNLQETLSDVPSALSTLPKNQRVEASDAGMYSDPIPAFDEGTVGSYSTDSGDVSWNIPLGRFTAATWPVGTPAHSWQAVAASGSVGIEGCLFAGKVIGTTLCTLLSHPDLLADARTEFEERTANRTYKSSISPEANPYELINQ